MSIPYFPSRGESEISHTYDDRVTPPWRIYKRAATVLSISTLCVYAVAFLVWGRADGWRVVWRGICEWWEILAIPFPLWWGLLGWQLVQWNYRPKMRNDSWPPPWEQVNVRDVGLLTAANADDRREFDEVEEDEPAPPQRTVRVEVITNGGRTHQYADLPDLPGLPMFARVVTGGKSFSHRTARMCSIKRPQFEDLARTFRDKGWAVWRDPHHTKQGTELLVVGHRVLKDLAALSPTPPEGV